VALAFREIVLVSIHNINPMPFSGEQLLIYVRYLISKQKIELPEYCTVFPSNVAVDVIILLVSSPPEIRVLCSGVLSSLNNEPCPSN